MLSPRTMAPLAHGTSPIPGLVLRGWERFADLVEPDVADAVFAIHQDPATLAGAMEQGPTTLLHGDLWLVNLAIEPDLVVFLDWALATTGPAALDVAIFLTGSAAHMEPSREGLIELFRIRSAELTDDRAMDLALLAGLAEMGWNKALDAIEHSDPGLRARERADLDWWVLRGRDALDRWSL
jgi:aminoglycoside phosphotransferase (APT) family kinase protein